ncbi:hypothetical protein SteCoe_9740 [Stentor coeruleus]|uniref:Uncharacterized protein n=1 Tax=Stentor coeruleus TaxID=5963 RepID=A0A1R2CH59_9CILI|nr:hypothetical protein SteCoe_9740 [Stentor coeruleus]
METSLCKICKCPTNIICLNIFLCEKCRINILGLNRSDAKWTLSKTGLSNSLCIFCYEAPERLALYENSFEYVCEECALTRCPLTIDIKWLDLITTTKDVKIFDKRMMLLSKYDELASSITDQFDVIEIFLKHEISNIQSVIEVAFSKFQDYYASNENKLNQKKNEIKEARKKDRFLSPEHQAFIQNIELYMQEIVNEKYLDLNEFQNEFNDIFAMTFEEPESLFPD